MKEIPHVLPEESGGDTTWFERQNKFEQAEIRRQVDFKRRSWPELGNGRFAKLPQHTYPHILPDGNERLAFYAPIADKVLAYLDKENIALHTEALNFKSSQVACFNFLFPLRQNTHLATDVFRAIIPNLDTVENIEFEFTGPFAATKWLGEPAGGKRGQNRTSIDAAVFWTNRQGKRGITLIEWKYTEHNYGVCSAFAGGSKEEQAGCKAMNVARDQSPHMACILTSGKRHCSRNYWQHMPEAGIYLKSFTGVVGCPFQGPFYQLLRQFLLAAFLRGSGCADEVDVMSIGFSRNTSLAAVPPQLQPLKTKPDDSVIDIWNRVLVGVPPMRHIHVEELMGRVDQVTVTDPSWRHYLFARYEV